MPLPIFSGGGILLILNDLHNKKDTQQTFYKLFKTHNKFSGAERQPTPSREQMMLA